MENYPLSSSSSFYSVPQSFSTESSFSDAQTPFSSQLGNTHLPNLSNSQFSDPPILPSTSLSLGKSIERFQGNSRSHNISPSGYLSGDTSSNHSLMSPRVRNFDVYVGVFGLNQLMVRFVKWLRAELEMQGVSCFIIDRIQCKGANDHGIARGAMDVASFGVVVITKRSFSNPYTMEEIQFFLEKKNLVPIFFEISQVECNARDIIERKGEVWDRYGGRLWEFYGGSESQWREIVNGISMLNLKLEANVGNFRDCVNEAVVILGSGLGRRRVVERVKSWKNLAAEEFPFPRNSSFVGRNKEILELELLLFGEGNDSEKKIKESKRKGKEWMVMIDEDIKVHGKGVACVTGDSGIGKTELLLEYSYRFFQMYKMVLWVGGESRYFRQNYMDLLPLLEIDTSMMNNLCSNEPRNLEDIEEEAIRKIRKELARDIPYLLVIDNLEREKDWWYEKDIMELLPRFGGATHVLISTRLPLIMKIKPLRLLCLSNAEAMLLMNGGTSNLDVEEVNALRLIEEKVGRLPLGLALVGALLYEFSMKSSKLLDSINNMTIEEMSWDKEEDPALKHNPFLIQLLDYCFSVCCQKSSKLALRLVQASVLFAPSSIPIYMLSLAARETFEERQGSKFWKKYACISTCMCMERSDTGNSEAEVLAMLVKLRVAKSSNKVNYISFHDIMKLYAHKRGENHEVANSVVRAISLNGSLPENSEHIWAACFLLFKFEKDQVNVQLPIHELLPFIEQFVLPLATHTFSMYFRGKAALELLQLATEKLEALENSFLSEANNNLSNSASLRSSGSRSTLQASPQLYQKFAHLRAALLETRAKIMLRGGSYDIGERLCRTAVSIKEVIYGWEHPETVSSRETLEKLIRHRSSF